MDGQVSLFGQDWPHGKMCPAHLAADSRPAATSRRSSRRSCKLKNHTFMLLNLNPGAGNLLGPCWEYDPVWLGSFGMLNTSECPSDAVESSLSQILEAAVPSKYYLSRKACLGILRRARERGKPLPPQLEAALNAQAGLTVYLAPVLDAGEVTAFAVNQRDEVRDLHDVAGALSAQPGMKQQTFVAGIVSKGNGDCFLTPECHTSLSGGGGQAGQGYPCVLASNCLNPWDTQQTRVFTPEGTAPTLAGADGGGGRNPAGLVLSAAAEERGSCLTPWDTQQARITSPEGVSPTINSGEAKPGGLVFAAGFCAGAGPSAGSIGYQEEVAPTLKGTASGNMMPSVLCLNDQGGRIMECSEDISGTLRAQEHGHQPLVFENHGIDARYTGPHSVAPTLSCRNGTGGNNLSLVLREEEPVFCITGNIIDRQPHNGGNGIGIQEDVAYTLTATDHHAVFARQRADKFQESDTASTQSAHQEKDATDLIYQETIGALTTSDSKGPNAQYVSQDKLIVETPLLIRRLTPRECERLQGLCSAKKNAKLFVEAAKIGANPQIALHNSMAWVILWSTV